MEHSTVSFRGHTTDAIDFNALETTMQSALEKLPNIDRVIVERSPPTAEKGYDWFVTFIHNFGMIPPQSGDMNELVAHGDDLLGYGGEVNVTTILDGTVSLAGFFTLTFNASYETDPLPVDASEVEMEAALEGLDMVGDLTIQRITNEDGFSWFVTFGACAYKDGHDVCNDGNLPLLQPQSINMTIGGIDTVEIHPGSGPGMCEQSLSSFCELSVTQSGEDYPYQTLLTPLEFGEPTFVRLAAGNALGLSWWALTSPEYAVPSHKQPGPPPPVRLVRSTSYSITVDWEPPFQNGGAAIAGYELWMDDWADGSPRMVYDGTDVPTTRQFTVSYEHPTP